MRARLASVAGGVALLGAVAGAVGTGDGPGASTETAGPLTAPSTAQLTPAPVSRSSAPDRPSEPSPRRPTAPDRAQDQAPTTSGALSAADLPLRLRGGWRARVPAGGEEAGFIGNGTPVRGRAVARILEQIGPGVCGPLTGAPAPVAALQGTYANGGAAGAALLLQFDDADRAASFHQIYAAAMAACVGSPTALVSAARFPASAAAPGAAARRSGGGAAIRIQQVSKSLAGAPWQETAALSGDRVLLLSLEGSLRWCCGAPRQSAIAVGIALLGPSPGWSVRRVGSGAGTVAPSRPG